MITKIAKKEFIEMLRDGRFRWTSGMILLLLLVALGTGWQHAEKAQRDRDAARVSDRETWLAQGPRNPHSAAHFAHYAFKPTPFLSYVDRGLNSYLGTSIWLEAHYQDPAGFRPAEDANSLQRFGELTAAWTLQYLIPLLIIILAFASFAGERERGTLRQLKSLGLSGRHLALGKMLGVAAALAIVLTPSTIIAVAILGLSSIPESFAYVAPRLTAMTIVYLLYFTAFLAVALAVSAKARSARLALLSLLGFWIGSSLLLPRLAAEVAESIHPTPTVAAFGEGIRTDVREGIGGQNSSQKRRAALEDSLLQKYGVDKIEDLPVNFAGIRLQASEEYSNLVFDKHYGDLWQTFANQEEVQMLASLLSPTLAVRSLSMGLAGTDLHQHRHFADAAEQHRRKIIKQLNDDMIEHAGDQDFAYLADPALWAKVPQIEYQSPSFPWVLSRYMGQFVILVGWCLMAFFIMVRFGSQVKVT
ncbi:DUF3526 domain-containing protein [bacterium]|nr:DUF3526 domain-containing protein [bacterium]